MTDTPGELWKAKPSEFTLAEDFAAVAESVGAPIEECAWTLEDEARDDVEGHTLKAVKQ